MTAAQLEALAGLIGKPYRLGANGPEAFDCYGLAREVQRLAHVDLPIVGRAGDYLTTLRAHGERQNWRQVRPDEGPREFDLVLMANVLRRDRHVGVYVRPVTCGTVIHAIETMGVCLHSVQELRALGMNEIRYFRRREPGLEVAP